MLGGFTDHCTLRAGMCSGVQGSGVGRITVRFARGCARGLDADDVGVQFWDMLVIGGVARGTQGTAAACNWADTAAAPIGGAADDAS